METKFLFRKILMSSNRKSCKIAQDDDIYAGFEVDLVKEKFILIKQLFQNVDLDEAHIEQMYLHYQY